MKRDFLKELGVEDDKIESIMKEYGNSVNTLKEEKVELETKYSSLNESLTSLQDEYSKLDDSYKTDSNNFKSLEKELNDLKPKYEEANNKLFDYETTQKIKEAGVNEKFVNFVKSEVQGLVTNEISFENALKGYLETNPQYKNVDKVKVNSSASLNGSAKGTLSPSEAMNNAILSAFNKK